MSKSEPLLIVGFAGSLRKESYNKMLLYAASELMPKNVRLEILDLGGFPSLTRTWSLICLKLLGGLKRKLGWLMHF
jgi:hypothetical protein